MSDAQGLGPQYPQFSARAGSQVAEATRKVMRANRSSGSELELRFRRDAWAAGLRGYRRNYRALPGSPDLAYTKSRIAVFLHGCFWHGCPRCTRRLMPTANRNYWEAKIEANRTRHERVRSQLESMGYTVLVYWECDVQADAGLCIADLAQALAARQSSRAFRPPDRVASERDQYRA